MTQTLGLGEQVILYGAGNNGRKMAKFLGAHDVQVRCFLDRRAKQEQRLDDIPVLLPSTLSAGEKQFPVIISLFNRDVPIADVRASLRDLGFDRLFTYLDVHNMYQSELADDFWLTRRSFISEYRSEIAETLNALADAQSRELFRDVVAFRESGDFKYEPQPDLVRQYFPADLDGWPGDLPLRLVDCGAYIGDTIMLAQRLSIPMDSVAAFEPDPQNFTALGKYVRLQLNPNDVQAVTWPCGVSDTLGMHAFAIGEGESTKETSSGGCLVQCVALDDVVYGMKPNMIKMDVEGSEIKALAGAMRIIERFRPALAISIYHTPAHLWEIPLLVASWGLNYKLHIRSHGHLTFDTILYAIPTAA